MRTLLRCVGLLCIESLLCSGGLAAQPAGADLALVGTVRVWDRAPHSAFTSLLAAHGGYYLAFREGERHVHGVDGTVRILFSEDLQNWRSLAWLARDGVDLRDPKLSTMPDGRILVTLGGSYYEDRQFVRRQPMASFSDGAGRAFAPPEDVVIDPSVAGPTDWLWRLTWRGGSGYGVVYQPGEAGGWALQLVVTRDGRNYRHLARLPVTGRPGEVTLRFTPEGRMVALSRREAESRNAAVGISAAPYRDWAFTELPLRLGGPDFAVLPDGRMLVGGRDYRAGERAGTRTVLGWMDIDGGWQDLLHLPSGGDTSYPGILVEPERVVVSYYSSHEGKAAIYLAWLRWRGS